MNIQSKLFKVVFDSIMALILSAIIGFAIALIAMFLFSNNFMAVIFILFLSYIIYPYAYNAWNYLRWSQDHLIKLDPNKFYEE